MVASGDHSSMSTQATTQTVAPPDNGAKAFAELLLGRQINPLAATVQAQRETINELVRAIEKAFAYWHGGPGQFEKTGDVLEDALVRFGGDK